MKTYFRLTEPKDCELLYRWWNDPQVMKSVGFPEGLHTTTEAIEQSIFGDKASKSDQHFIFCDKKTNNPVGELHSNKVNDTTCEIGIKIGEADYLEKGYASDVLDQFISYLFTECAFEKITLSVLPTNSSAIHLYHSHGFQDVDYHTAVWTGPDGVIHDAIDMCLDKKTYRSK